MGSSMSNFKEPEKDAAIQRQKNEMIENKENEGESLSF